MHGHTGPPVLSVLAIMPDLGLPRGIRVSRTRIGMGHVRRTDMNLLSLLVGRTVPVAPPIPPARLAMAQGAWKRRTSDIVMDAFKHAMAAKNLEDANDLLELMETWQIRRPPRKGLAPRQEAVDALRGARMELERLRGMPELQYGPVRTTAS